LGERHVQPALVAGPGRCDDCLQCGRCEVASRSCPGDPERVADPDAAESPHLRDPSRACGSRSVRLVLPASTCARIPKFSVRTMRHVLWVDDSSRRVGHERSAHLALLGPLVVARLPVARSAPDPAVPATDFPLFLRGGWPASPGPLGLDAGSSGLTSTSALTGGATISY
jgi:hypothetical protein